MTLKEISFILLLTLLSCKEEQKFDYSLLEGHWLLDSLYIDIQDEFVNEKKNHSLKFYSISENLIYDTRVDISNNDFLNNFNMLFNHKFDKEIPYYYERLNDSIFFHILLIDTILKDNTNYKIEFLNKKNMILSENNNDLFYTKQDFKKLIPVKDEFIKDWKKKLNK